MPVTAGFILEGDGSMLFTGGVSTVQSPPRQPATGGTGDCPPVEVDPATGMPAGGSGATVTLVSDVREDLTDPERHTLIVEKKAVTMPTLPSPPDLSGFITDIDFLAGTQSWLRAQSGGTWYNKVRFYSYSP